MFELLCTGQFQPRYGSWPWVIRSTVEMFLKCGDLREEFARVRCPDCGKEMLQIRFIDKCLAGVIEKTCVLTQGHNTFSESVLKLAKIKVNFNICLQEIDRVTHKFNT